MYGYSPREIHCEEDSNEEAPTLIPGTLCVPCKVPLEKHLERCLESGVVIAFYFQTEHLFFIGPFALIGKYPPMTSLYLSWHMLTTDDTMPPTPQALISRAEASAISLSRITPRPSVRPCRSSCLTCSRDCPRRPHRQAPPRPRAARRPLSSSAGPRRPHRPRCHRLPRPQ